MSKPFIHDDFLLHSKTAKRLFHEHAENMPVIDYHCHLNPQEIFEDKAFKNLFEVWLSGDHYKWRLMRANGVTEPYVTGDKNDFDKFMKWAEVVPELLGNPLYHWTHFELKRFFGIDDLLSPKTAKAIYENVNEQLKHLSARKMITMSGVETIVTTDDPVDDLKWHKKLAEDNTFQVNVLPAFRPDKAININLSWFNDWVNQLAGVVGYEISDLDALEKALVERIEYFHENGSRIADHGLDQIVYQPSTKEEVAAIFSKARQNKALNETEIAKYKGHVLVVLGRAYHRLGWVQQYHIGAQRNLSKRMFNQIGPDTGFDAINDQPVAQPLTALMNALDETHELPKTIIYTLNPRDFEVAITSMQAFQGDGIPGKIQFGSAWWFLDNIDGMTKQIKALGNNGLLARFVGMLTDSRSFLSYPRHEYFRRILCNFIGDQVENGLFPDDDELLGRIVEDICYYNTRHYFNF